MTWLINSTIPRLTQQLERHLRPEWRIHMKLSECCQQAPPLCLGTHILGWVWQIERYGQIRSRIWSIWWVLGWKVFFTVQVVLSVKHFGHWYQLPSWLHLSCSVIHWTRRYQLQLVSWREREKPFTFMLQAPLWAYWMELSSQIS